MSEEDKWVWMKENTSLYSVKSSYMLLSLYWNVWFGLGMLVLWNAIVYKYIIYLYDFLNVLNSLWDVSHSPSVCLVCVWAECHPCRWVFIRLRWWCYMRDLGLHFCWSGEQSSRVNPLATELVTVADNLIGDFCFDS